MRRRWLVMLWSVPTSRLIAESEELFGTIGGLDGSIQLRRGDLLLTAAGAGNIAVNDVVIRQGINQATINLTKVILALPQFLCKGALLHL